MSNEIVDNLDELEKSIDPELDQTGLQCGIYFWTGPLILRLVKRLKAAEYERDELNKQWLKLLEERDALTAP